MPQDRLKSAVYRSFVTCDDPKGVVECKTVRKSKIDNPNMEKKVVKQRTSNHLNVSSSSDKEEKREYSSSSLQLMEVSREAQKLNQVIDSWSKGMSFEKHSKDIAKDLLKGALDLQESLVMLGKLQEASQHMAKLKKEQKDKPVKSELDGIGIERTKSERISDDHRFNRLEFQKPRFSVDGASRDCFDELREVIRESFARQNLLPPSCASEKSHFDRRKVELSPDLPSTSFTSSSDSSFEKACVGRKMIISSDIPSTSSSQSSMIQSQEVNSFDYSPPKIQQEKREGPNLIARLMGLEGIPRKPQHSTIQKHLENDRVVKQRRPVFEIDLPKAKKSPCIAQKVDAKRRTLDEIIETMHLQGLSRSKSMDKSNHGTHQSSVSGLLQKFVGDSPPIVIMKPLYAPDLQAEGFPPCIHEDKPSGTRKTIGKWDVKEENSPENSDGQKGASNFTTYMKLQTRKDQNSRFSKEKGCKDHGEVPANSKTLEVLIQEKQCNTKTRASSPGKTLQPKKEAIEKRVERTQRVAPPMRKSKEMKNAKLSDSAKLQDQSKLSNMKVRKSERKPLVAQAKSTVSDPISKRFTTTVFHNSSMRKKNVKTDKSIKSSSIRMVDNVEHKDEKVKVVVHPVEENTDITITKFTSSEELHFEEVVDISENPVIDNIANGESFSCEATMPSIHCASDIKLIEHTNCNINVDFTEKENFNSRATTRYLLLSSESFLCRAEELFETDAWEPTVWQTTNVDHEIADSTLLLDCANELLENKRSQLALAVDPLSRKAIKIPKISISFDKLVNEICDGIETLRNYNKVAESCDGIEVLRNCNKVAGKTFSVDTLYALLERDLWCKGVVSSAWDLGWRLGFTNNDVEQVVTDIERYLLTGAIDDLLTEFRL